MKKIIFPIIAAIALSSFAGDWPQYKRTPDRVGCALDETITLPSTLCAWFDFGAPVTSSPAVVGGKAYVLANNGLLACLDLAANTVVWKRNIGGAANNCSPAVGNGKVYAGSVTGVFYVLDAVSGDILNQYDAGAMLFASPLLLDSGVYFGDYNGIFHALDLNGDLKWKDTADLHIPHAAAFAGGQIVYVDGNTDMIWLQDSGTYAKRILKTRFSPLTYSSNTGFVSGPVIWRDTVIIGCSEAEMGNTVYYVNFLTGALFKAPSFTGDGGLPGLLMAGATVDTSTGRVFIATGQAGLTAGWRTTPSYSAYPSGLYATNTPPAVVSNCVIFGSENDQDTGGCSVHFYNKETGANTWSYKPASYKGISGGPAVSDGKVLVGSMDGCVYGFWSGTEVTEPVIVDSLETRATKTIAQPGKWTLTLFPNPASSRINLSLSGLKGDAVLSIFGINGRLVRTIPLDMKGLVQWDLRDNDGNAIPSGNYLGVVRTSGKSRRSFNILVAK